MISKLNTLKPNTKLKLCMFEKLSTYNKKKDRELIKKGRRRSPTLKLSIFPHAPFVPTSLFPVMHPGGEVNFRKRGSKFFLPLSHRHQTLHLVHILLWHPPPPYSPPHTHTRMRQTPDPPLSGSQVYIKGYICYHPASDSRGLNLERGKFVKNLWCCTGGRYNKIIWFSELNWKYNLATVKSF